MRGWLVGVLGLGLLAAGPAAAQDPALVERGRYLVEGIAGCGNCHTPKGPQGELPGMALAGGFVIDEPGLFRVVVPDTPPIRKPASAAETDAEVALAIREGRRPDGSIIGPPMPIELYRGIADRDLAAMVAYLRTVPAVRNAVGKSRFGIPLPPAYGPPVGEVSAPADNPVARGLLAGRSAIASNATPRWGRTAGGTGPDRRRRPAAKHALRPGGATQHHPEPGGWYRRLDRCAGRPGGDPGHFGRWPPAPPADGLRLLRPDPARGPRRPHRLSAVAAGVALN